jgi:hypothetical protein
MGIFNAVERTAYTGQLMLTSTKDNHPKTWSSFWHDQSGQGAVEFAGFRLFAAVLVYFTVAQIRGGQYDPTNTVVNEFNSFYNNLGAF